MASRSNAERQQAYRDRKRQELEQEGLPEREIDEPSTDPPVAVAEDLVEQAKSELGISLEDYVERAKSMAAAYADEIGEDDRPHPVSPEVTIANRRSDRIARAEQYARWRYQGVLDGEVTGL